MNYKHNTEVSYTTRSGRKGFGLVLLIGGIPIMCHNDPELHNYEIPVVDGYQYGFALPSDPIRSGSFVAFKIVNELFSEIIEKSTPQGKIFKRIYKQFDSLVFVGGVQKNIDDCSKPSAIVTAMDMEYLKETGWKPVVTEESADEKLKGSRNQKKF